MDDYWFNEVWFFGWYKMVESYKLYVIGGVVVWLGCVMEVVNGLIFVGLKLDNKVVKILVCKNF